MTHEDIEAARDQIRRVLPPPDSKERYAARLAVDALCKAAKAVRPESLASGAWRCEDCGELLNICNGQWRMAGDRWQHSHGQAGHIDARYLGETVQPESLVGKIAMTIQQKAWWPPTKVRVVAGQGGGTYLVEPVDSPGGLAEFRGCDLRVEGGDAE